LIVVCGPAIAVADAAAIAVAATVVIVVIAIVIVTVSIVVVVVVVVVAVAVAIAVAVAHYLIVVFFFVVVIVHHSSSYHLPFCHLSVATAGFKEIVVFFQGSTAQALVVLSVCGNGSVVVLYVLHIDVHAALDGYGASTTA